MVDIITMIVFAVSLLAAFLLGSWVTYKSYQHKNPVMFMDKEPELPDIISPWEQEQKSKKVMVKV